MSALGSRIRKTRKRMHLTQEQVASRCKCSKSLLSKIENGRIMPAVSTLTRIADTLKVPVSAFIDDSSQTGTVHIRGSEVKKDKFIETERGYSFFAFAPERSEKLIQPFLFEVEQGKVKHQNLTHTGEEFVYMLEGTVTFRVGDITYTLNPEDSLYFDAEEEHEVMPVTGKAKYIGIFTEAAHSGRNEERTESGATSAESTLRAQNRK